MKKTNNTSTADKNTIVASSSTSNHLRAWKWFEEHGYKQHKGLVLHHVDTTMKSRDPERYNEWRPEDLQVMTVQEHRRLHMKKQTKGVKHTKQHNKNISQSIQKGIASRRGKLVFAQRKNGEFKVFSNSSQFAAFAGVTKQWANRCISTGNLAKGWKLQLVSSFDEEGAIS